MAENCDFLIEARSPAAESGTVSSETALPMRRRGRPPGMRNRVTKEGKSRIAESAPWELLIRVMEGRTFMRAEEGGRVSRRVKPTLEQSVKAAELLLRRVVPEIKAQEVSGPGGAPVQTQQLDGPRQQQLDGERSLAAINTLRQLAGLPPREAP